jgi:hypothetical protein
MSEHFNDNDEFEESVRRAEQELKQRSDILINDRLVV